MAETQKRDALEEMRRRYALASDHVKDAYDKSREDVRFVDVPGNQWDAKLRARRGDRPTYEFPKLASHCRQIINEMRQSRPQAKIRGVEESDRALAELMQGIIRNIESVSNAEQAYDIGFDFAVKGGIGFWRICTDYAKDDDFELDIFIKPVRNPFAVKFDPAAVEIDRRDANFCFVEELIPVEEFRARYPKADLHDFDEDSACKDWREAGQVRVAEYWEKVPRKRRLLALSDGRVVFLDDIAGQSGLGEEEALEFLAASGIQVVREREVQSHKVQMRLTNGHEWLTEPYEFPSKYIPIVPVWGNIQNIDGEDVFYGMVRPNKDQQRLHNVHRTAAIEAVAKAPKAPFVVKLGWIKGLERFWRNANSEDYPYLPVNDSADALPQRAGQAEIPAALLQLAALDNEDIKASTGQYDASLGARSNETSGRAILQRKLQGATATFNYIDNLAYAIRYSAEILVDMIPRVYDTQRVVRVLGEDGGAQWKTLYQEVQDPATGRIVVINDIRKGKYDVTVTVGPSFATQRLEAVDAFTALLGQIGNGLPPPISALMAYTVVKNMDLPGADQVDAAFRKLLVQMGVVEPGEGDPPPSPPQPDPKSVADAEAKAAQARKVNAEADSITLDNMARMSVMAPPEPDPWGQFPAMNPQPPSGGFFMPDPGAPAA